VIVSPFPAPPVAVQQALALLDLVAGGDEAVLGELGDVTGLPRPWLPATCPPVLRRQLWSWCDAVVTWINHGYAWRPASMIPECWPQHPHLACELPALACLRVLAEQALTPDPLEDWHRYALPAFLDRAVARLGESSCRTGKHLEWPGAARYDSDTSDQARARRLAAFAADTGCPAPRTA
jgi:hypothetical protein